MKRNTRKHTSKRHIILLFSSLIFLFQVRQSIPDQPYRSYTPPEWYQSIWDLTWNLCTSKFRESPAHQYTDIKWYIVYSTYFNKHPNGKIGMAAMTYIPFFGKTPKVYVAQPYIKDISTIAHEMMHVQGIHVGAFNDHPLIFEECGQCIKLAIVNFQRGQPALCIGD